MSAWAQHHIQIAKHLRDANQYAELHQPELAMIELDRIIEEANHAFELLEAEYRAAQGT